VEYRETRMVAVAEVAVAAAGARLRPRLRRRTAHQLAAATDYQQPRSIQRVLDRSVWDAEAVRDDLRTCVVAALGEPAGVLVVAETGLLNQGTQAVGGTRQDSGTAGRSEHGPIGGCPGYASPAGRAGLDRAVDLSQAWTADVDRRAATGVPQDSTCQPTPQLALSMVTRALDGGVPAAW